MMKVLVLNGPNINLIGIREPEIYGNKSYKDLVKFIKNEAKTLKLKVKIKQSNIEGKLVNYIQKAYKKYDYIIINAGAYTHTSVAILDALKGVNIKTIEVHLSDPDNREDFRQNNFINKVAIKTFKGKGFDSYKEALMYCNESKS